MSARGTMTPIVLLVLAAGAVAYALVDRETVSDADRAARRGSVLPSLRVEDVTRIRLDHGAESLEIERDADAGAIERWMMTSPRREPADGPSVDVLLRELELAKRLRSVEAGPALGLDPPRARGVVVVGRLVYRFALGADAPRPEGSAYLSVDGEGTFVVDRSLKVQLLRRADAYRNRTLVPYGAAAMARIENRAASGATTTLERNGATFRIAASGLRASRTAVEHLLSSLSDARVDTFVDDRTGDSPPPAFAVTIFPRDEALPRVELGVDGPCPDAPDDVHVVRGAPSRVSACVPSALVDALRAPLPPDPSPFFAHADEMEEVRLEPVGKAGASVEVARRGSGWRARAPEERELTVDEGDSVAALVLALAEARGTDVRASGDEGLFRARARVSIVRTGTSTREVVDVAAAAADGTALARRADDGAVLLLPRTAARRFEPQPVVLRGGSVWRTSFDPGSVVRVDDGCAPARQVLELADHRWTFRVPAGREPDPVAVSDLIVAVAHAKASAWIADADDGGFGFEPGGCLVSLGLEAAEGDGPARRVSISFGALGDGGVYARTQDDPAVFVAPEALLHSVSRSATRAPPPP